MTVAYTTSRDVTRPEDVTSENEAVGTLVRRPPVAVGPDTTLRRVAQILAEESIGAVVVRRERPDEAPHRYTIGVVSERDISHAIAHGIDPDTTLATDVMTTELAHAEPGDSIVRVAARMIANEVRHLPVTRDEALIGVISERDVFRALVQAMRDEK